MGLLLFLYVIVGMDFDNGHKIRIYRKNKIK